MEDMARYSDDVIVLAGAKILRQGTREEVFAHVEELAETGLDVPQITHLMRLLRERGINAPKNVYTVAEATAALKELFLRGGEGQ
jgi:energy-coupling factor transport system ATP-binding protein